ncbi:TonB-dependent receptor plug domain-containing protein [Oleiharenicola lentus]|uniref:TonB-dependent receptor plug domain-containing protein n=1 Tax=Oleiharenicola lentus TaxID=2508720 RepID=UPI003F673CDF
MRLVLLVFAGAFFSTVFAYAQRALPSPAELKKLGVDQLMDIEVTSVSKRPEKLSGAASAIQVITGEDIRRSGATRLPEALRLASNLQVAQIDSRQWAISSRGFNNVFADKMLVLIDGRTVYTPLYAGVYWDVQDTFMADLDRIEVISGPGATQWGANAVNGVINITTKNAKDTQGGLLVGGGGTALRGSGGVRYGGQIAPNLHYRVYGKYFERGESDFPSGNDARDDWRMRQGGVRLDWAASSDTDFTLQADAYAGEFARTNNDAIDARGRNLLGRWSRKFAENSDVKLQAYYDRTHRNIPGSFTQTLDTYDLDFQHRLPVGLRQDLVWGASYRLVADDIVNTPANAFLPAQVNRESFSVFVQDDLALVEDRLHFTFGSKLEHNEYTDFEVEPSARLAWTLAPTRTVWAAISRAVRTPSRIDRDLYSPAVPPYRVAGGPAVISETLIAYELGYRQQLAANLTLSLATFYNDYDDLRSLEPLNPPAQFPLERTSNLRGRTSGAELTLEWRAADNWRLHLGYTELRVHSESKDGAAPSDRSISRDPNHQLVLRSLWTILPQLELDATGRYVAGINNQSVPAYAEMDLRIGWRPRDDWSLSVVGQNLLHDRHAEFNVPGGRREIARNVFAEVAWHF